MRHSFHVERNSSSNLNCFYLNLIDVQLILHSHFIELLGFIFSLLSNFKSIKYAILKQSSSIPDLLLSSSILFIASLVPPFTFKIMSS